MYCMLCNKETINPKFCSKNCSAKYNNKIKPKRKPEGCCKMCKQPTLKQRTYCVNCWYENSKTIISKGNLIGSIRKKTTVFCLHCKQKITGYNAKFCHNNKCYHEYKFQQRIQEIEQTGIIYSNSKFNTSASFAKRYLKFKFGNKCAICNQSDFWNNKPLTLILDHINGIPNDWSISNVRLVCPNCDTQLPTYKSKNNGNGRPRK